MFTGTLFLDMYVIIVQKVISRASVASERIGKFWNSKKKITLCGVFFQSNSKLFVLKLKWAQTELCKVLFMPLGVAVRTCKSRKRTIGRSRGTFW